MDSRLSRPLIPLFVRKVNIDMSAYEKEEYASFNAFFTRKVRKELRPLPTDETVFFAPCDGRLSVYPITAENVFPIKGSFYDVKALLGNNARAKEFEGGTCLVFRLCVDDYHRYHFFDNGTQEKSVFIPGKLHTVRPIALENTDVFIQNCREYTLMETEHFGLAAQIEVGALLVGKIHNLYGAGEMKRGGEKGCFYYGGSTVVVLLQKGRVLLKQEIAGTAGTGEEIRVKLGQTLGFACNEK